MQESQLRISASCLFEAEVYDVAFLNFLSLAEMTDSGLDWYRVGYAALALGGFSKALEAFQKAKTKEPDLKNAEVDAMIALIYSASPIPEDRDGTLAISIAKRILREECDQWKTDSLLAAAHADLGEFDNAKKHLKEALSRCPTDRREELLSRMAQYESGLPFRLSIDYVRQNLREFGKCARCNANTNISQGRFCVRCMGILEKRSD